MKGGMLLRCIVRVSTFQSRRFSKDRGPSDVVDLPPNCGFLNFPRVGTREDKLGTMGGTGRIGACHHVKYDLLRHEL